MTARPRYRFITVLLFAMCMTSLNIARAKTADVILNDDIVPLGVLDDVLQLKGYDVNLIKAQTINAGEMINRNADLLIILGGRQSVTRLYENPFLYEEITLIRDRTRKNRPTLGLCLGAQLIALAFGGKVEKGPQVELGWTNLVSTKSSLQSPAVQALLDSETQVYSSHEDVIEAPADSTLLAKSELYNQIFVIGKNTVAVQFHPESTPQITREWFSLWGKSEETTMRLHQENEIAFERHGGAILRFLSDLLDEMDASHLSETYSCVRNGLVSANCQS